MTNKFGSGTRNSGFEMEPVNKPKKRSHKRVVNTGVELFLPSDFILHEKLVYQISILIVGHFVNHLQR